MNRLHKRTGFLHEKLIVIPDTVLKNSITNPIVSSLFISDIGYFPFAQGHFRERSQGSTNHIFIFCVSGKGIVELGGQKVHMKESRFCVIPSNTPHSYYADDSDPWSIYWIHFNGILSPSYLEIIQKSAIVNEVNSYQHSRLIKDFNQCFNVLEKGFSIDKLIAVSNHLGLLFTNIHGSDDENEEKDGKFNPVDACIDFMLGNVRHKLDLDTLSTELSISRSHLIHLFKEQTGFTPINYFIHLKVQKACTLLDTTELSIKEISHYIGYDDPLYFSRIFKKIMAQSPITYRNTHKG